MQTSVTVQYKSHFIMDIHKWTNTAVLKA